MGSQYLTPYQPPTQNSPRTPQLEYEVSHHQNRGQGQVFVTNVGTFSTIQDAQDAAQDALRSALEYYVVKGWSGYYCNDIDLMLRGLITGLIGQQEYECLSEIHIHAREKLYEPFQGQLAGIGELWMLASGINPSHTYLDYHNAPDAVLRLPRSHSPSTFVQPQKDINSYDRQPYSTRNSPDSFSQTRPPYPNRPSSFVPRPSGQYDQIMSFSTRPGDTPITAKASTIKHPKRKSRPHRYGKHKRASKGRQENTETDGVVDNALGGGYNVGESYLGRRHSSIDLPSENTQFQYAIEEQPSTDAVQGVSVGSRALSFVD